METSRERYRRQNREQVKQLALEQLAERGAAALSLNAIAKRMGMTGPALYRYFDGRDALLNELVMDAYRDLGDALWAAVGEDGGEPAGARLRALARAYRDWAHTQPARYLLLFGTPVPGYSAPAETTPLAQRALGAIFAVYASAEPHQPLPVHPAADADAEAWAARAGQPALPGPAARTAVTFWTRLHGLLSLEIEGHFGTTLPDPALVYESEVEALVAPWEAPAVPGK